MKVIFMGTPEFAVPTLEKLYNKGYEIELVITQEDKPKGRGKKLQPTPVKHRALELGLKVYQPKNINTRESMDLIKDISPDFIIVVAYGQILKKDLLETPKYGCFNVHASILPKYRGAAPINWAIIDGQEQTGVSIMKMEEGLDSGDTIVIGQIKIQENDDFISIHDKLAQMGGDLMIRGMEDIIQDKAVFTKQNHEISTYAPMIFKDIGHIEWNNSGRNIFNKVRGLKPWPNAFTYYGDEMVKIHQVSFIKDKVDFPCGTIVSVNKTGINVAVIDGQIIIEKLQFPGKKVLTVAQYLAGNEIEIGYVLE
ncbi:methionyl-tRNA formyltransferase [Tissierella creatinini]|nr:methionyl-tRNA formyltransferase [Tissierella creatinini]TJX69203.1 methionyl-tRNA formyltransferase [Soehngenia saccharolytica]